MSARPWFIDAFTADYLEAYPHRDEAGARVEARAVLGFLRFDHQRQRLLDLACGAGRHSLAFRAERCHVTGMDLSADLIARARETGLATVRGDMRALPFRDWAFDAVTLLFSSFGYFEDDAQHQATLVEIARVLTPGGGVFLDLMIPETVRQRLVPQGVDSLGSTVIEAERWLSDDGRRVHKAIRMVRHELPDRQWEESVRLFAEDELRHLAAGAGLSVEGQWGDYDGRPVTPGETRRLLVLRKPR